MKDSSDVVLVVLATVLAGVVFLAIVSAAVRTGKQDGAAEARVAIEAEHKAIALGLGTYRLDPVTKQVEFVEAMPHLENPCKP